MYDYGQPMASHDYFDQCKDHLLILRTIFCTFTVKQIIDFISMFRSAPANVQMFALKYDS